MKKRLTDLSVEELEALRLETFDRWCWGRVGDKYGKMLHDFCEAEIKRKKEIHNPDSQLENFYIPVVREFKPPAS